MEWVILFGVVIPMIGTQFALGKITLKQRFLVSVLAGASMVGLLWFSGTEGRVPFKVLLMVLVFSGIYRNYTLMRKRTDVI